LADVLADTRPFADHTDEWLVQRCGEPAASVDRAAADAAFVELMRRYRDKVFRLAVSILGQGFAPEAEDVAQDVMLRVHRSLHTFRGDSQVGSWIYRITFNHALNVKDRVRFRAPHIGDDVLATRPAMTAGPDDELERTERRRAVLAGIEALPEVYQSALRLHYWLGASVAEIAAMLDTPENTVKSYLYRARQLLRASLTERGFDA
jgi:RNA polymerase sigma-70 factor (ECF subfamily)